MVLFQSLQFKNSRDSFKRVYAKREENSFTARVKYSSVKLLSSPFFYCNGCMMYTPGLEESWKLT